MAVTDISSSAVRVRLSFDAGITYKKVVCKQGFEVDITKEVTKEQSDCQQHVAVGNATDWSTNFEFILNLTPESTECSAADIADAAQDGTLVYIKVDNADSSATYYRQGTGYITNYKETGPLNGLVKATGTLTGVGTLDLTA